MAQQRHPVFNSDFPGVPTFLMLLALIPFIWPWIVLHGTARLVWGLIWTIFVDIPFLAVVIVNWWQKESARQHEKHKQRVQQLRTDRLVYEALQAEQPTLTAEQKRQAAKAQLDRARAERERVKAERRQTQTELFEELRLREQRRRRASPM